MRRLSNLVNRGGFFILQFRQELRNGKSKKAKVENEKRKVKLIFLSDTSPLGRGEMRMLSNLVNRGGF
jgi:hypothetical protein